MKSTRIILCCLGILAGCSRSSSERVSVAEETLGQARDAGVDYHGHVNKALDGSAANIAKLARLHRIMDAAASLGHGHALYDVARHVGDERFAAGVSLLTRSEAKAVFYVFQEGHGFSQDKELLEQLLPFTVGAFERKIQQEDTSSTARQVIDCTFADNGYLSVGFMYWCNPSFLMHSGCPYLVVEIERVSEPGEMRPLGKFCSVDMKVIEVIGACPSEIAGLKGIRTSVPDYISVTNGTRIVTSFTQYENENAIPHYGGTNCGLGHRLDRDKDGELTDASRVFLEMLRRTAGKDPDTEDLRVWAHVDPTGTAELLSDRLRRQN